MKSVEIGLLLCDHLDDDVATVVGDYPELFPDAFLPAGVNLRIYEVTEGDLPGSTDECRGWITSGSRYSAYDDEPWIAALSEFTVAAANDRVPHMGICFGHQLIAQALGGRVERSAAGWGVGAKEFEVINSAPWMQPASERFRVLMSHQDQVVELPEGGQTIAAAPYCPVGAYRVDSHVFCVQGHPEFVPELNRLLIEKRRSKLGEPTAGDALASLDEPLDHALLIEWTARFFDMAGDMA
ncbi:MAG: gamma-glutamyl-gamma-aminobutyrate hydrolase family protein [Microthrixaceae bacterium]